MKAIRFHALGDADVLRFEDVAEPTPGPGEVLLRVRTIGVNYADTLFRRGLYVVAPVFPQIPGMEAAGEIVALGPDVGGFAVGDRVMAIGKDAYAEYMLASAQTIFPIPAGLDFEAAAALPVQGLTAYHCLFDCARLAPGESVLVHSAAGGVGTLAVQLAKRHGAGLIVGTCGSDEKLPLLAELGVDVAVNYQREIFTVRARRATLARGVDVILEMLGTTENLRKNLVSLAPFGRMVVYGAATLDTHGTIEPLALLSRNQSVLGYYLFGQLAMRERCARPLDELARLGAEGALRVLIGGRFPLSEAGRAHLAMESRRTTGKLVLVP